MVICVRLWLFYTIYLLLVPINYILASERFILNRFYCNFEVTARNFSVYDVSCIDIIAPFDNPPYKALKEHTGLSQKHLSPPISITHSHPSKDK